MDINIWPEWHIVGRIGSGSYGTVYEIHRGNEPYLEKAAMKVIRIPSGPAELEQLSADGIRYDDTESYLAKQVEDIRGEIRLMQHFVGFSNIVSYEDYLIQRHEQGVGWDILIRMELLTALSSFMAAHPMMEKDVLKLGLDISQALMICHKAGIIHRDIKPQNIFLNSLGFYKLGDFGISRAVPRSGSVMSFKGTVSYMAPETFSMRSTDARSDIYSLALVMYRILNEGREPFLPPSGITPVQREAAQYRRLRGEPLPPPSHASREIWDVLSIALSPNPQARYQTAAQFHTALSRLLPLTDRGQVTTVPKGKELFSRRSLLYGILAIMVVLLTGSVAAIFLSSSGKERAENRETEFAEVLADGQNIEEESGTEGKIESQEAQKPMSAYYTVICIDETDRTLSQHSYLGEVKKTITVKAEEITGYLPQNEEETIMLSEDISENVVVFHYKRETPSVTTGHAGSGVGEISSGDALHTVRIVSYYVYCEDAEGGFSYEDSYEGISGSIITVAAPSIDGYIPRKEEDTLYLSEDEEENYVTFVYDENPSRIPSEAITYKGHQYYACRSSEIDSFWEADSYCRSLGGYLAVINDSDENRMLYDYVFHDLGYKSAYFGYTDDGTEGNWYWAGGDSSSYENWAGGQPDNLHGMEHYALFYYTDPEYKWNDGDFGKDSSGEVIFLIEWG